MKNEHQMAQKDATADSLDVWMKALYAQMQTEEQKGATQKLFEASDWELNQVHRNSIKER